MCDTSNLTSGEIIKDYRTKRLPYLLPKKELTCHWCAVWLDQPYSACCQACWAWVVNWTYWVWSEVAASGHCQPMGVTDHPRATLRPTPTRTWIPVTPERLRSWVAADSLAQWKNLALVNSSPSEKRKFPKSWKMRQKTAVIHEQ